ncbi:MAG: F0F1 ATP synthase subunit B [Planctomycetota bacterium]
MRIRLLLAIFLLGGALLVTPTIQAAEASAPAAAALAADGSAEGDYDKHGVIGSLAQGTVAGLAAIVIFLVVLAILGTQVWPKIAKALDEREKKILDEIESAEAARQQAKDALDQYESSLAEARAEAQQMLEKTKADQQKLASELRAKSETELRELKEKAQRDIEAARRAAVSEIYAEASQLATTVAEKILRREVSVDDQQKLVDEAVAELQNNRG